MLWESKSEREDFIGAVEEALVRALKDFYRWKVSFDESDEAYAGRTEEHFPEGQAGETRRGMKRKSITPRVKRDMTGRLHEVLDSWKDWKERMRKREPEFLRYLEAEMVDRIFPRKGVSGKERKDKVREARRIINSGLSGSGDWSGPV